MNLKRRHLSQSQVAMITADALPLFEKEAKKRQKEHAGTAPGKRKNTLGTNAQSDKAHRARDDAAKMFNVSPRYVESAKVIKKESPKLARAV